MASRISTLDILFLALYVVLLVGISWAMFVARDRTLAEFDAAGPQQQWQAWREAVKEGEADMGNVKRKVPRSAEPPTLVLLRDHFTVCLVGLLGISSVLYGSIVFLVRGVIKTPAPRLKESTNPTSKY
jgi:hypothetical protein